jgi:hypothetical protein
MWASIHRLGQGTPQVKKALYAALVEEIRILSDDTLQPVFRIPLTGTAKSRPRRSRLSQMILLNPWFGF